MPMKANEEMFAGNTDADSGYAETDHNNTLS